MCGNRVPSRRTALFVPFYIQHLWTAHASGGELETQVEIGKRLELFTDREAEVLIADAQEIGKMINGLVRSNAAGPTSRDSSPV